MGLFDFFFSKQRYDDSVERLRQKNAAADRRHLEREAHWEQGNAKMARKESQRQARFEQAARDREARWC
jgi:HPt (histidine-containing phosphotransfer) domain-containing protein